MKKINKLLLVIILVFTLVGCGSKSSKEDKIIDGMTLNAEFAEKEKDRLMELRRKVKSLDTYDIIAHIDSDSFVTNDDGSSTFTATGPNQETLHFYATNADYINNELVLYPDSTIQGLESMGVIYACTPVVTSYGNEEDTFRFWGGYTFSDKTQVNSSDELFYSLIQGVQAWCADGEDSYDLYKRLPNFIGFGAESFNTEPITLSSFVIHYSTERYTTGILEMNLFEEFYPPYLVGAKYDSSLERFNEENQIFDFYLRIIPDIFPDHYEVDIEDYIILDLIGVYGIDESLYTIGDLRDENGNIVDKSSKLNHGYTLDVTVGDITYPVKLNIIDRYEGADSIHELIPNVYPSAIGDLNVLVVPICWQDSEMSDDDLASMKEMVGKVSEDGQSVDYTGNEESLSSYFNKASYGKLNITSYFTDWYQMPSTFQEMKEYSLEENMILEIQQWLQQQNLDMSLFDQDHNLLYDAVIFLNNGKDSTDESYVMYGFEGAVHTRLDYTNRLKGTEEALGINAFITENISLGTSTLIHEFGHTLGLIDYYDVSYSGIDAVGGYDMQSQNIGDWNAYSKYAVNWIEPAVISDLTSRQSIDVEIGAFQTTGDAIVIPAAGSEFDGPFDEYIMIDLFSDTGLASYATNYNIYDIKDALGVRIYHVNAKMEKRELEANGETCTIGTVSQANNYSKNGKYLIELIQNGGTNTFTDLEGSNHLYPFVSRNDFFYEGDQFDAEDYTEFLIDGKMDNGNDFGYKIQVVSIDEQNKTAIIRITRK